MPKKLELDVSFNKSNGEYQPGDLISGNVIVESSHNTKVQGILVRLYGGASVSWKNGDIDRKTYPHFYFTKSHIEEKEVYFDKTIILLENFFVLAGHNNFPWEFELPRNIPSSYQNLDKKINIFYRCKAKIMRSKKQDITLKKKIIIMRQVRLTANLMAAVVSHKEEELSSGSVNCYLSMDKKGFLPGDEAIVDLHIINHSKENIGKTILKLKQLVLLTSGIYKCEKSYTIMKFIREGVSPLHNRYISIKFRIPTIPSTSFEICRFIDIRYVIEIELKPNVMSFQQVIVIGSCSSPAISHNLSRLALAESDLPPGYDECILP